MRPADVDGDFYVHAVFYLKINNFYAAERVNAHPFGFYETTIIQMLSKAADAVTAHLCFATIRIHDFHICISVGIFSHIEDAVAADAVAAVADEFDEGGIGWDFGIKVLKENEIIT